MTLLRSTHRVLNDSRPTSVPPDVKTRSTLTSNLKPQIKRLAIELGVHPEALRGWIRQAEADAGEHDDRPTAAEREELAALRKENAQLKRASEAPADGLGFFRAQRCATRRDVDREVVKATSVGPS